MYFFPGPFIKDEHVETADRSLGLTINSGKNALRLALRSFGLLPGALIGIPAFCCNEVINAVIEEEFVPCFFDSEKAGSYWAFYNEEKVKAAGVRVIIITHLYGYVHPGTKEITEMCRRNNVRLIHDAAQSFGVDTSDFGDHPVIYSFGPGKSTTAARGGEVLNIATPGKMEMKKAGFWNEREARFFFNSRLFREEEKRSMGLVEKLCLRFKSRENVFFELTPFQKQKALQAKMIAVSKKEERKERYLLLKAAIAKSDTLSIAYEAEEGLFFKIVLYVDRGTELFLNYLRSNNVPYCRLGDSMNVNVRDMAGLPYFEKTYKNIIELSSERSVPLSEIKRVAAVLANYKGEN
jgi:hypothetical protein